MTGLWRILVGRLACPSPDHGPIASGRTPETDACGIMSSVVQSGVSPRDFRHIEYNNDNACSKIKLLSQSDHKIQITSTFFVELCTSGPPHTSSHRRSLVKLWYLVSCYQFPHALMVGGSPSVTLTMSGQHLLSATSWRLGLDSSSRSEGGAAEADAA